MGTREWTEMTEKEELIVGEIDMGQGSISPVPVDAEIVPIPESHVDAGTVPIPENHVDARTVPIPENHIDVGTVPILENHVDTGTIHAHASMPIGVQTPQTSNSPIMPLWML